MTTREWFEQHRPGLRGDALVCGRHQAVLDVETAIIDRGRVYGPCCFREAIGYAQEVHSLNDNLVSERMRRYFGGPPSWSA